jgi:splicing factor 45
VPESQVGANQAVRIFVKFQSALSAQRAVDDLNGRYFGGRIVTATFFDAARFERLDLAPLKEEMITQSL